MQNSSKATHTVEKTENKDICSKQQGLGDILS